MHPDRDHRDDAGEPEDAEERAWRAIVENYGERPELDDPPEPDPEPTRIERLFRPVAWPSPDDEVQEADHEEDHEEDGEDGDEEGYVPPPPPPLPRLAPDRLLAWAGVLGSPLVLLLGLVLPVSLPGWLGFLLIAAFVGGFVYLVAKMPRGPRDPWDDGAQI